MPYLKSGEDSRPLGPLGTKIIRLCSLQSGDFSRGRGGIDSDMCGSILLVHW
jgi:hypothetical protein